MRELLKLLQVRGYNAELHEPDVDDPPGGVIDISGYSPGALVITARMNCFVSPPPPIGVALRKRR
jgi:hypothetical protein